MRTRAIRQKLLHRRRALLARYHDELERADEELESRETEDVERATEQWDAQVLAKLGHVDALALAEIVAAIRRIDAGQFGRCGECGGRIESARLEALPTTQRCIDCASTRAVGFAR